MQKTTSPDDLVNPRRMREGYGSWFVCVCVYVCVCVCVYLSVTALTATYIILKSKVRYHRDLHGVLNICNVWLPLKALYSKVMASFTYHGCLLRSLTSSQQT